MDPEPYGGNWGGPGMDGELFGCVNDANDMRAIAESMGRPTLRQGGEGPDVAYLQRRLNEHMHHTLTVDGIFGRPTASAVRAFQRSNGLKVDAIVGPHTWATLEEQPAYV